MIGIDEIARSLRRLHMVRARDPVPEELRGWSNYMPPVKPRASLGLGVGGYEHDGYRRFFLEVEL